jgi:hypothetical protein
VATFVGFEAIGLGCFVAEHSKTTSADDKGDAMALVQIRDGSMGNISTDKLKLYLGKRTLGSGIGK